jgi:hypothetical protein
MRGSESSRPAARCQANRALFLQLLYAPYRSIRLRDTNGTRYDRSGRTRSTS